MRDKITLHYWQIMKRKKTQDAGRPRKSQYPSRSAYEELKKIYPEWSQEKIMRELNPELNVNQAKYLIKKWRQEDAEKALIQDNTVHAAPRVGMVVSDNDPDAKFYSIDNGMQILDEDGNDSFMKIRTKFNVSKSSYLQSEGEILKAELKQKLLKKLNADADKGEWGSMNLMGRIITDKS